MPPEQAPPAHAGGQARDSAADGRPAEQADADELADDQAADDPKVIVRQGLAPRYLSRSMPVLEARIRNDGKVTHGVRPVDAR
jgi:hypothetical protein